MAKAAAAKPLKPDRFQLELGGGTASQLVAVGFGGQIYILFNPARNV